MPARLSPSRLPLTYDPIPHCCRRCLTAAVLLLYCCRTAAVLPQSTYQLKLLARVPVNNPNYLAASIEGDLHILFYRTVAGEGKIERLRLPPRASPKASRRLERAWWGVGVGGWGGGGWGWRGGGWGGLGCGCQCCPFKCPACAHHARRC